MSRSFAITYHNSTHFEMLGAEQLVAQNCHLQPEVSNDAQRQTDQVLTPGSVHPGR